MRLFCDAKKLASLAPGLRPGTCPRAYARFLVLVPVPVLSSSTSPQYQYHLFKHSPKASTHQLDIVFKFLLQTNMIFQQQCQRTFLTGAIPRKKCAEFESEVRWDWHLLNWWVVGKLPFNILLYIFHFSIFGLAGRAEPCQWNTKSVRTSFVVCLCAKAASKVM